MTTPSSKETSLMSECRQLIAFYDERGWNWESALAFTMCRDLFGESVRIHPIEGYRCYRYPEEGIVENPATWTKATHVISDALAEAQRQQAEKVFGLSSARIVEDALIAAGLIASRLPAAAAPDESQKPVPAKLPEAAAEELIPERTLIRTRGWNHLGQGAAEAIKRHIIAAYREGQQDAESKLAAAQPDGPPESQLVDAQIRIRELERELRDAKLAQPDGWIAVTPDIKSETLCLVCTWEPELRLVRRGSKGRWFEIGSGKIYHDSDMHAVLPSASWPPISLPTPPVQEKP